MINRALRETAFDSGSAAILSQGAGSASSAASFVLGLRTGDRPSGEVSVGAADSASDRRTFRILELMAATLAIMRRAETREESGLMDKWTGTARRARSAAQ